MTGFDGLFAYAYIVGTSILTGGCSGRCDGQYSYAFVNDNEILAPDGSAFNDDWTSIQNIDNYWDISTWVVI